MSSSLDWIEAELAQLDVQQLTRTRVTRSGKLGAKIVVDGKRYWNFGSNDYLGIAADPKLQEIVAKTVLRGGWGSGSSPLIVGRSALHAELERRLATYLNCEAALVFPSGFAANAGTIPCLVGRDDLILSDAKNHASVIDGCRLSGAQILVYPHGDMDTLAHLLAERRPVRRTLIVSDGLFSMDGDLAAIDDLTRLAREYQAMLLIDEAHALGVLGQEGRGVSSEFGELVDVRVGTLSKALGGHGGFVAGSKSLITYLSNRARSYVFSTASPAVSAAVALAALNMIRDEPERRVKLLSSTERVRTALTQQGWPVGDAMSHVIPLRIGDVGQALRLADFLRAQNLWVPCVRPPSVPHGESLLRISLSSAHTDAMLDVLLDALVASRRELDRT